MIIKKRKQNIIIILWSFLIIRSTGRMTRKVFCGILIIILRCFLIIRSSGMFASDNQDINQGRAGNYVAQIGDYKAFSPKPLPPNPPIRMDDEMIQLLSQADREIGRLDGTSEILPNVELFVAMYVNKEAVLSSQIEGTQASLIDVLAFEAEAALPENPQDIEEVINYVNALNYGLQRLSTLPLSLRLIREIHDLLMQGVRGANRRPGEFRDSQNWIGYQGGQIETAQFVPPAPQDMHIALNNLETFIHSESNIP